MTSPEKKETLTQLPSDELEELYERQKNILKNLSLVNKLPDKGKQLKDKFKTVRKELAMRQDLKKLEEGMNSLTVNCSNVKIFEEKHVQHICSIEKLSRKERYKPFATLAKKDEKNKTEKVTQLITLVESITLLAEQANRIPVGQAGKSIEGTEMKENDTSNSEDDGESADPKKTLCIY